VLWFFFVFDCSNKSKCILVLLVVVIIEILCLATMIKLVFSYSEHKTIQLFNCCVS
jgi:hypothetical protein